MAIYDTHPVYPHQAHLRFAYEPLKSIYVFQRLLTTLALVPLWVLYTLLLPRRFRPRPSWGVRQIVIVNFYRRIYKVTEVAGVTWGTRDPTVECDNRFLRETRFQWIPPLPEPLRTGVVLDDAVPFNRVGTFVWPRDREPRWYERRGTAKAGGAGAKSLSADMAGQLEMQQKEASQSPDSSAEGMDHDRQRDVEAEAGKPEVIGIFMHGGGYTQMSAHESAGTSRIPRRLIKDKTFTQIYAVEYRLLQHGPLPAAIQDAAAVYAHVVITQLGAAPDASGIYHFPGASAHRSVEDTLASSSTSASTRVAVHDFVKAPPTPPLNARSAGRNVKVVLIGDSAGGNLVLGVSRWIRDEGVLPPPDGLLLLSPSCDPSHAFPLTPSSYVPRPNKCTDYLVDNPEPRALLQRTFLGHHPLETIHSPYISPASARVLRAYGHPVDHPWRTGDFAHIGIGAIAEAGASAVAIAGPAVEGAPALAAVSGIGRADFGAHSAPNAEAMRNNQAFGAPYDAATLSSASAANSVSALSTPAGSPVAPARVPRGFPALGAGAIVVAGTSGSGSALSTPAGSPNPGAAHPVHFACAPAHPHAYSERELRARAAGHVLVGAGARGVRPLLQSTMTFLNPMPRDATLRQSLFGSFPRTFVTVGDAERLEREITTLVGAMKRDGVRLHVEWAKDAVHDMLMLPYWDERVREQVWNAIAAWVEKL